MSTQIGPRNVKPTSRDFDLEWERDQKEAEEALFNQGLREVYRLAFEAGFRFGARRWY
jgi:hypothetical protein